MSAKLYGRAAIMWAVGGGILFIPCAMLLVAMAWLLRSGWLYPSFVLLGILLTYAGAYLFFSGGMALLNGRPGWQTRLALAPWFAWNILLGLSMLHAGEWIYALIGENAQPPEYGIFLDLCVTLHLIANAFFIFAFRYVRPPAPASRTA